MRRKIAATLFVLFAAFAAYPTTAQAVTPANCPITNLTITVVTVGPGSNGGQVETLQAILRSKTGSTAPINGYYGPETVTAVKNFQTVMHLTPVTGNAGPVTYQTLYETNPGNGSQSRIAKQALDSTNSPITVDAVGFGYCDPGPWWNSDIQSILRYKTGAPISTNGIWTSQDQGASGNFQSILGMSPVTGNVGPASWQAFQDVFA